MAEPNSSILSWIYVMKTSFIYNFHAFNSFQSRPLPLKVFQAHFGLNLPIIVLKSGSFGIFSQFYDVFMFRLLIFSIYKKNSTIDFHFKLESISSGMTRHYINNLIRA